MWRSKYLWGSTNLDSRTHMFIKEDDTHPQKKRWYATRSKHQPTSRVVNNVRTVTIWEKKKTRVSRDSSTTSPSRVLARTLPNLASDGWDNDLYHGWQIKSIKAKTLAQKRMPSRRGQCSGGLIPQLDSSPSPYMIALRRDKVLKS